MVSSTSSRPIETSFGSPPAKARIRWEAENPSRPWATHKELRVGINDRTFANLHVDIYDSWRNGLHPRSPAYYNNIQKLVNTNFDDVRETSTSTLSRFIRSMANIARQSPQKQQNDLERMKLPSDESPVFIAQMKWNQEVSGYVRYIIEMYRQHNLKDDVAAAEIRNFINFAETQWAKNPILGTLGEQHTLQLIPTRSILASDRELLASGVDAAVETARKSGSKSNKLNAHSAANELQTMNARDLTRENLNSGSLMQQLDTSVLHKWDDRVLENLYVAGRFGRARGIRSFIL